MYLTTKCTKKKYTTYTKKKCAFKRTQLVLYPLNHSPHLQHLIHYHMEIDGMVISLRGAALVAQAHYH